MRYQIETFTICDGWGNSWRDDSATPVTFASYDKALKALNNHYDELTEDVESGFIEPYNFSDFSISESTE